MSAGLMASSVQQGPTLGSRRSQPNVRLWASCHWEWSRMMDSRPKAPHWSVHSGDPLTAAAPAAQLLLDPSTCPGQEFSEVFFFFLGFFKCFQMHRNKNPNQRYISEGMKKNRRGQRPSPMCFSHWANHTGPTTKPLRTMSLLYYVLSTEWELLLFFFFISLYVWEFLSCLLYGMVTCIFTEDIGVAGGGSGMAADIRIKEKWSEIHPGADDLLR